MVGALGGGAARAGLPVPSPVSSPSNAAKSVSPKCWRWLGQGGTEVGGSEEEQGGAEGVNWWRQLGINWEEAIMTSEGPQEQQEEGPRGGGH